MNEPTKIDPATLITIQCARITMPTKEQKAVEAAINAEIDQKVRENHPSLFGTKGGRR